MKTLYERTLAVKEILRERGIEATDEQILGWASRMVALEVKMSRTPQTRDAWMQGVIDGNKTATMCLHVCFGDAQ